jgi:hypothetical protein
VESSCPPFINITSNVLTPIMLSKARHAHRHIRGYRILMLNRPENSIYVFEGVERVLRGCAVYARMREP